MIDLSNTRTLMVIDKDLVESTHQFNGILLRDYLKSPEIKEGFIKVIELGPIDHIESVDWSAGISLISDDLLTKLAERNALTGYMLYSTIGIIDRHEMILKHHAGQFITGANALKLARQTNRKGTNVYDLISGRVVEYLQDLVDPEDISVRPYENMPEIRSINVSRSVMIDQQNGVYPYLAIRVYVMVDKLRPVVSHRMYLQHTQGRDDISMVDYCLDSSNIIEPMTFDEFIQYHQTVQMDQNVPESIHLSRFITKQLTVERLRAALHELVEKTNE